MTTHEQPTIPLPLPHPIPLTYVVSEPTCAAELTWAEQE